MSYPLFWWCTFLRLQCEHKQSQDESKTGGKEIQPYAFRFVKNNMFLVDEKQIDGPTYSYIYLFNQYSAFLNNVISS